MNFIQFVNHDGLSSGQRIYKRKRENTHSSKKTRMRPGKKELAQENTHSTKKASVKKENTHSYTKKK